LFRTRLNVLLNPSYNRLIMNATYKNYFKKVSIAWGVSIAAALIVNMVVISPQKENREKIRQQLVEKRQMYQAILRIDKQRTRDKLGKQLEQWRNDLSDFVASPGGMAGLTFDIGKIAKDTKVDSFSIMPQNSREDKSLLDGQYIGENQMNLNFKSSFNEFAVFLNALERHQPVIFVNEFSINQAERADLVNQVSMDLSVFVQKRQGF
jgi:hypothetical protein